MQKKSLFRQHGITLVGLIFVLAIVGCIGLIGLKVAPTVSEYNSVNNAIKFAKSKATSVPDARAAFDKQAEVTYIESITSKDLVIAKNGDDIEISFAYPKKIPLFGPVSLLIEYAGTTAKTSAGKSAE